MLAYNVPAFTGIDFAPSTLLKAAAHPCFVSFKDRSANVTKVAGVLAVRPDFQVLAGMASALRPFLILRRHAVPNEGAKYNDHRSLARNAFSN